jgi:Zn-dependent protease with chaperone function
VRLALLALAAFFLVQFAMGALVTMLAPRVIRTSARLSSDRAAGRLCMLRLAPAGVAMFVVVVFCIPSYLLLEPDSGEKVGWRCLVFAGLALVGWVISASRAARAWWDSRRYLRSSLANGRETVLHDAHAPVCLTVYPGPAVALAGIIHPRVIVTRAAAAVLSMEQLDVALRHERAHAESRDNLKRLAMLLAPNLLPRRTFAALEQAWARAAEWAADDRV